MSIYKINKPAALLIDLDGVLRIGNKPAEGLQEFFAYLSVSGRPSCIISNSTLLSSGDVIRFFKDQGINCPIPVLTTVNAALSFIQDRYERVAVYCSENVKILFNRYLDYENPQAVIIGDMGKSWNFEILNDIFKKVYYGAELVAMQKNRFWKTPEEDLLIDAGAIVSAVEYAAGKSSILVGKPSPVYFYSALKLLGYNEGASFIMLGDDIETDIGGANDLNGVTILIYTGKTKYPLNNNIKIKPHYEARNLFQVISLLKDLD